LIYKRTIMKRRERREIKKKKNIDEDKDKEIKDNNSMNTSQHSELEDY